MPRHRSREEAIAATEAEVVVTTWLHLSDVHFGRGTAGHRQLLAADLRSDIRAAARVGNCPAPDHIFVTGDIAFSGGGRQIGAEAPEYELARRWLEDLAADLGLGLERVFLVPGNHDIDREVDADRETSRLVRGAREGLEGLDDVLLHPDDVERLRRRMGRYLDFARPFGPREREDFHEGLWWRQRVSLREGVSLRLCGLNTALLSADDDDQGRLRVGNRQLVDLLMPSPSELEIVVVLSHHPITGRWLADEAAVRGRFDREASIHLFGHLHEADSEQARHGWGAGCLRIAAGAAHAEATLPGSSLIDHGYSFGALVLLPDGQLVVRLWPRRWSSKSMRFVADSDNIDERKGYAEHVLRHRVPRRRVAPLASGDLLGGRYLLLEKLGEGGVGQVWKAEDTSGDREIVAVKVLNPDGLRSPAGRRQAFFRGAGEIVRVRHPAIVRILDPRPDPELTRGPHDYYVMEFVDGQNLGQAFRSRRCEERRAVDLLRSIIDGIAAAHACKVVHRDLKPSNVLLGRDGAIKIVDFDTVKDVLDATRTRTGGHLVSDLYASPEVLDGGVVDERADVYSIAVTGIFLLRGEDPPKSAINRMYELAASLDCSPELRDLLSKGCAHDSRRRYSSIEELRKALDAIQRRDQIVSAAEVGPVEPPRAAVVSRSDEIVGVSTLQNTHAAQDHPPRAVVAPSQTPTSRRRHATSRPAVASGVIEAPDELAGGSAASTTGPSRAAMSMPRPQAPITAPSIPVQSWWEGAPRSAASTTPGATVARPPSPPAPTWSASTDPVPGNDDGEHIWPPARSGLSAPARSLIGLGAGFLIVGALWCSVGGEETPTSTAAAPTQATSTLPASILNTQASNEAVTSPRSGTIGLSNSGLMGIHGSSADQGSTLVTISNLEVQGGLDKDIVRRIMRAHINELRNCYSQGLSRNPNLGGHVSIHFRIGIGGAVSSATVADSGLRNSDVTICFEQATRRWKFPKAPGESVVAYTAALARG